MNGVKKVFIVLSIILFLSILSYIIGEITINYLCETDKITNTRILSIVYDEYRGIDRDLFFLSILPFTICCRFLYWIGTIFNWTYQETSIYVCIYVWQILLILSTIPILIKSAIKCIKNKKGYIALILSICYTALYCYFTVIIFKHYPIFDINYTFNLCVNDLQNLAQYYNVSYEIINVCIYLIGFVIVCWINYLLYSIINIKRFTTSKRTSTMSK